MSVETVPKDLRNLRACLVCSLIKTFEQFEFDGCDNCDEFLRMKNNKDNIYDCTSSNFDGMIALMSPEDSWVAKWQRINRRAKGVYAISVSGRLPDAFIREMKSRGITYRLPRVSPRSHVRNNTIPSAEGSRLMSQIPLSVHPYFKKIRNSPWQRTSSIISSNWRVFPVAPDRRVRKCDPVILPRNPVTLWRQPRCPGVTNDAPTAGREKRRRSNYRATATRKDKEEKKEAADRGDVRGPYGCQIL